MLQARLCRAEADRELRERKAAAAVEAAAARMASERSMAAQVLDRTVTLSQLFEKADAKYQLLENRLEQPFSDSGRSQRDVSQNR